MIVGYLVNQYPHVSHSFIRREIAGVEAAGVTVQRFAIRPPGKDVVDPADREVFDIRIFRAFTTYQFSERLLFRNISEFNTFQRTLGVNLLLTYRVNSGTVFFVGYDDHYQEGDRINPVLYPEDTLRQTNRAIFTKFSYLFRYGL